MHPGLLASSLQNMAPGTEELHQLYLQRGDFTHGEEERLLQCSPAVTPLWRKAHSWATRYLVNSRGAGLEGGGLYSSVSVISWAWEKVLEILKSIMGIKKIIVKKKKGKSGERIQYRIKNVAQLSSLKVKMSLKNIHKCSSCCWQEKLHLTVLAFLNQQNFKPFSRSRTRIQKKTQDQHFRKFGEKKKNQKA